MARVAVLGAGLTGSLVALELADRGYEVDLFDRRSRPLSRASAANEGKIHLGYVYAMDPSLATARTMIRGAAAFRPLVERWIGSQLMCARSRAPFIYAVPKDSMLSAPALRRHFAAVSIAIDAAPFGKPAPRKWHELDERIFGDLFDPALVTAAFQTEEDAFDPTVLCDALRETLAEIPRISQRMQFEVVSAREENGRYLIIGAGPEGEVTAPYSTVVNALWEQRLWLDSALGISSPRPVVHRYKIGLRTKDRYVAANLPCVTFVLGSYGDTVGYPDSAYASWYPTGLLSQEIALRPSRFEISLTEDQRSELIVNSLRNLRKLMPGAASSLDDSREWEVVGGYITAWGKTGIEERESELHQRHAVGVHSSGNYHSIDTGKLTLAPLFAAEACARIASSL